MASIVLATSYNVAALPIGLPRTVNVRSSTAPDGTLISIEAAESSAGTETGRPVCTITLVDSAGSTALPDGSDFLRFVPSVPLGPASVWVAGAGVEGPSPGPVDGPVGPSAIEQLRFQRGTSANALGSGVVVPMGHLMTPAHLRAIFVIPWADYAPVATNGRELHMYRIDAGGIATQLGAIILVASDPAGASLARLKPTQFALVSGITLPLALAANESIAFEETPRGADSTTIPGYTVFAQLG